MSLWAYVPVVVFSEALCVLTQASSGALLSSEGWIACKSSVVSHRATNLCSPCWIQAGIKNNDPEVALRLTEPLILAQLILMSSHSPCVDAQGFSTL